MRIRPHTKRLDGIIVVFALAIVAFMISAPATASTGDTETPVAVDVAIDLDAAIDDAMPPLPVPYLDHDTGTMSGGHATDKFCYYESKVDNPHISANRRDVSAHGYWIYHNGTCSTATVQIWLYHARWSSIIGEYWALTDYDIVRNMPSNPPVSGRANARHRCATMDRAVTFVAVVDVDIDDHSDPSDRPNRRADINCVPW